MPKKSYWQGTGWNDQHQWASQEHVKVKALNDSRASVSFMWSSSRILSSEAYPAQHLNFTCSESSWIIWTCWTNFSCQNCPVIFRGVIHCLQYLYQITSRRKNVKALGQLYHPNSYSYCCALSFYQIMSLSYWPARGWYLAVHYGNPKNIKRTCWMVWNPKPCRNHCPQIFWGAWLSQHGHHSCTACVCLQALGVTQGCQRMSVNQIAHSPKQSTHIKHHLGNHSGMLY